MAEDKDLVLTQGELVSLDKIAMDVIAYSEDDRRKADSLYKYYQELIEKGDSKGDTRVAMAKSLELRENSVNNLIEILKLKTRLVEKKISLEMKRTTGDSNESFGKKSGVDTNEIIQQMEDNNA